jgi:hypothetical protein
MRGKSAGRLFLVEEEPAGSDIRLAGGTIVEWRGGIYSGRVTTRARFQLSLCRGRSQKKP